MTTFADSTNSDGLPFATTIHALAKQARTTGVEMLLVGATARDIALAANGHAPPTRATNDVDIVIMVAAMDDFAAMTATLTPHPDGGLHKFLVDGVKVDIVPFGGVERADRSIEWSDGTVMNTLGFMEALGCALCLELSDDLTLHIASLPGLAALKILAWQDRHSWTDRDAVDIRTILHAYSEDARLDDVYAEGRLHILEEFDYEPRLAGAFWLGSDVSRYLGKNVAARCADIIDKDQQDRQQLPNGMRGRYVEDVKLLDALVRGMRSSMAEPLRER